MAGISERIYFASPVWVQQIGVTAYGWWWYRRRMSPHFYRLVAEYQSREHWTYEQFRDYQEKQLSQLLQIANHSPYYQTIFREAGVDWQRPPFEILAGLPFLSKETLRTRSSDMLTESPLSKDVMVFRSSGTTGTPTDIYYISEFHALELALPAVRNLGWAGVDYRARRVMFGVRKVCSFDQDRPPFWRYSPAENMAYASIYHLSSKFLPAYVAFLRDYQPAVIMGYPNSLFTLARYALDHGDLPAPSQGVFTTSETVTEQIREALEAAWQCKVFDRYGAVEGCMFASQCEYGRYHISPDAGIIEILNRDGQPCQLGEMGEVICTGLQNLLQPLIRYQIGDAARWAVDQDCPCGRHMLILETIEGRLEDICITEDGRQMLRFDTVFKGVENIREAQVIQEQFNLFVIYVVPADQYDGCDAEKIKSNLRLHVGNVQVKVEIVNQIKRTTAGKFQAVVCKLSQEEKNRILGSL